MSKIDDFVKELLTKKDTIVKSNPKTELLLSKKEDILKIAKDYKKSHDKIIPRNDLRKLGALYLEEANLLKDPAYSYELDKNNKSQFKCSVSSKNILDLFSSKTEKKYIVKEKKSKKEEEVTESEEKK